jgi:hypothetical protein
MADDRGAPKIRAVDIGMFLGSMYDAAVDRMSSTVVLNGATLMNKSRPYSRHEDVTKGFQRALLRCGGLSMAGERLDPGSLYRDSQDQPRWYNIMGNRRPTPLPGWSQDAFGSEGTEEWVLCITFTVQGGSMYMMCYNIPGEPVDFPPNNVDFRSITPLDKQIMSFQIVSRSQTAKETEEEEEEEDDDNVVLDMTEYVGMMAGPDGCFFGRAEVDIVPAMAMAVAKMGRGRFLEALMGALSASPPGRMMAVLVSGDGSGRELDVGDLPRFAVSGAVPAPDPGGLEEKKIQTQQS